MKLKQARKLLINYLKENFIPQNNGHSKQDDWRNIVTHCFRVEKYAYEIANSLDLTSNEENTVRRAAIFHDIGYCKDWKKHPIMGKEILDDLLDEDHNKSIILNMVENHLDKKINDDNILFSILKDADILDK
ncbi:MAG: HD domain-containing protein [Bacillota bacterium]